MVYAGLVAISTTILPTIAMGLPVVACLAFVIVFADRVLRALERRGWVIHPRHWTRAGVGNALLELHLSFEPDRPKIIQIQREERDDTRDRVGDGREPPGPNVIRVDFANRRRG